MKSEMVWPAKAYNFFGQVIESSRAIHYSAAKIPGRLLPSFPVAGRKVNQLTVFGVLFRFPRQLMEPASRGGVTLHLPVPIIILKRMQQRLQLASFLWRKLVYRGLDFGNRAHIVNLSARRSGVNLVFTSINFFSCPPRLLNHLRES